MSLHCGHSLSEILSSPGRCPARRQRPLQPASSPAPPAFHSGPARSCLFPSRAGEAVASSLPASVCVWLPPSRSVEGSVSWPGVLWVSLATIEICCVFGPFLFACFSLEWKQVSISRRELFPLGRALLLILYVFPSQPAFKRVSASHAVFRVLTPFSPQHLKSVSAVPQVFLLLRSRRSRIECVSVLTCRRRSLWRLTFLIPPFFLKISLDFWDFLFCRFSCPSSAALRFLLRDLFPVRLPRLLAAVTRGSHSAFCPWQTLATQDL